MLHPILSAKQAATDPDLLYVEDLTQPYNAVNNPTGYGGLNLSRPNLTHIVFRLTNAFGRRFYTRPITWNFGIYPLLASAFLAEEGVIQDVASPLFHFEDGQYDLTYEIWAKTFIPAQTANYHLKLALYNYEQIWVLKNGAWVNITSVGTQQDDGSWQWIVLDTTDVYSHFEARVYGPLGGYTVPWSGEVDRVTAPSPTLPTQTSTEPKLVAATFGRLLLTQRVSRRLAIIIKKLVTSAKDDYKPVRFTLSAHELLLRTYTTNELLLDIQQSGEQDSLRVAQALTDVQNRVNFLETQVNNYSYA